MFQGVPWVLSVGVARYKWYISGIYCQLGDYMPPTTFYGNKKQPLIIETTEIFEFFLCVFFGKIQWNILDGQTSSLRGRPALKLKQEGNDLVPSPMG